MATDKKSFILYCDQQNIFNILDDATAGKLIKHIFSYVNDQNPETDDVMLKLAFEPIKTQLKRDLKSYEKSKEEKSHSGKIGNLKRWQPDLYQQVIENKINIDEAYNIANDRKVSQPDVLRSQPIAKIAVNVNDNVNVNVTDNVINKENDLFSIFWAAYPKKEGKAMCEKKFNKLSKKEQQQIVDHVEQYKSYKQFEGWQHPNPLTYLNQKRYLDVVQVKDVSNGKWLLIDITDPDAPHKTPYEQKHEAEAAMKSYMAVFSYKKYEIRYDADYTDNKRGFVC